MSEIRTAGAIMRDAVAKLNSDLIVQEVVSRKTLSGSTKYAYCPLGYSTSLHCTGGTDCVSGTVPGLS